MRIPGSPREGFPGAIEPMSANPTPAAPTPPGPTTSPRASTTGRRSRKDLRHRLNQAIPHELLKELHRKSPARHVAIAARQFAMLARGLRRRLELPAALDLDPGGARLGLDRLQLHGAPARGRCTTPSSTARTRGATGSLGLLYAVPSGISALAVHALAPDAPRRARRRGGRSEAALPLAQDQQALVQAALLHAGALSDLLPRGAQGDRDLSAGAPAADRAGAPRRRSCSTSRVMAALWAIGGLGVLGARLPRPGLPRLPDRVRAEPPRPALRDRPDGSGQVGLDPEALPLLGLLVPLLGLPPRAPLLPGRAVLQPAPPALRAAPVLRRDRLEDRRPTAGSSAAWIFENKAPHTDWHLAG